MNSFKAVLDRIAQIERGLGVTLIFAIVVAITTQVFTRYALGRPIAWVEESATYAFIWMVFIGASYGLKQGRHIVINTFVSAMHPRAAAALRLLVWLLVLGLLLVLLVQGFKVIGVEGRSNTISLPIELPRSWFYSVPLTVSAAMMLLTTLYQVLIEAAIVMGLEAVPDKLTAPP